MKRPSLVSLLGLVSLSFALAPSSVNAMKLSQFHSYYGRVLQACADVGGVWSEDSGGYGCTKNNCDGLGSSKGGDAHTCTVGCTYGSEVGVDNCNGSTPRRLIGKITLRMVLQNGDNVNYHYDAVEGPIRNGGNSAPATEQATTSSQQPAPIL